MLHASNEAIIKDPNTPSERVRDLKDYNENLRQQIGVLKSIFAQYSDILSKLDEIENEANHNLASMTVDTVQSALGRVFQAIDTIQSFDSEVQATKLEHQKVLAEDSVSLPSDIKIVHDPVLLMRGRGFAERLEGHNISRIVLHTTDNNSLAWTLASWATSNNVSAHYVIDTDGTVYHIIPDSLAAQHAAVTAGSSFYPLNSTSIGIEAIGSPSEKLTDAQQKSLENLTQALASKYDISAENIISHEQANPDERTDGNENLLIARLGVAQQNPDPDQLLSVATPDETHSHTAETEKLEVINKSAILFWKILTKLGLLITIKTGLIRSKPKSG
jgi:hypothetical protein